MFYFECFLAGVGAPESDAVRRHRRKNLYLLSFARGFHILWDNKSMFHALARIHKVLRYVHRSEFISSLIRDDFHALHHGSDGNNVVGIYINHAFVTAPSSVLHSDVLSVNIHHRIWINPAPFTKISAFFL